MGCLTPEYASDCKVAQYGGVPFSHIASSGLPCSERQINSAQQYKHPQQGLPLSFFFMLSETTAQIFTAIRF